MGEKPKQRYSSVLKTEAVDSSETLVKIYQTTRRYISGDNNLHDYRRNNIALRLKCRCEINIISTCA
jgi:hypothetical protein